MDTADIHRQRLFLDDSARYGKGRGSNSQSMTTKPCPGCGRGLKPGSGYWSRPSDRVCDPCRQLLYDALSAHENRLRQETHALHFVERRGYYEGHHPHKPSWLHEVPREQWEERMARDNHTALDPGSVIEEIISQLAKTLSADLPTAEDDPVFTVFPKGDGYGDRGSKRWLRRGDALLLRTLDAAIRQALRDRSEAGEKHGRNLLGQLATGELSVQKFNDLTLADRKKT
jgi:hypothetical protein